MLRIAGSQQIAITLSLSREIGAPSGPDVRVLDAAIHVTARFFRYNNSKGPFPGRQGDRGPKSKAASCRLQAKDYMGKWVVLFFYPKDFTFVCPTEIIAFSDAAAAFAEKDCAVIGASTDSAEVHLAWINTPRKKGGLGQMKIPLLAVCFSSSYDNS